MKIIKKISVAIFIAAAVFLLFALFLIGKSWLHWQSEKEEVLSKLVSYKKQLDHLRLDLPAEDRGSAVELGTVALPSRVFDRHGVLIGEFFSERRSLLPIEKLPEFLPQLLVASEDRSFYSHGGINPLAILRALAVNLLHFRYSQGGSTITQQLSKVLFTNQEKSLERKIFEFFCAREIESHYTKKEILEMYLNLIYTGHGNYGVDAAAQYYFNHSASQLTPGEAAIIVGLLPNPRFYSPIDHLGQALERQKRVFAAMGEMGFLTSGQIKTALAEFRQSWKIHSYQGNLVSDLGNFSGQDYRLNLAPFFLEHIRQQLVEKFSSEVITRGGLKIYTTLDAGRQQEAKKALQVAVEQQKQYFSDLLRHKVSASQQEELRLARDYTNGAFISLEPATGDILVMIGGAEFSAQNQFNRALLARRPTGSLIKPFVYYQAIAEKIITPATMLDDSELVVGDYKYENYDHTYLGKISARDALKKSRNTTVIRLLQSEGIDEFRGLLERMSPPEAMISERVPRELGIALGTASFTPLEMAAFYAILLNQGRNVEPRSLLKIEDSLGKLLWQQENAVNSQEILDPVAAYIVLGMMQSVFESGGTAGWVSGLDKNGEKYVPFEIAGKTGTTSDYRDAWFAGLVSDEAAVLWIGNDRNLSLGAGRSGGSLCAPAWVEYIRKTRSGQPPLPLASGRELTGVTRESFCNQSGGVPRAENPCADLVKDQVFYSGTEPRYFDNSTAAGDLFGPRP